MAGLVEPAAARGGVRKVTILVGSGDSGTCLIIQVTYR